MSLLIKHKPVLDRLLLAIARNPNGGTLTLDMKALPSEGYAVSLNDYSLRLTFTTMISSKYASLSSIVEGWLHMLDDHHVLDDPSKVIGWWYDAETGHWWLDVSVIIDDHLAAMKKAICERQLTIYSYADRTALKVPQPDEMEFEPCQPQHSHPSSRTS